MSNTEGIERLIGKHVVLIGSAYVYYGKIKDVMLDAVVLERAAIVYETGDWKNAPEWRDAQPLPNQQEWDVSRLAIESFGVVEPRASVEGGAEGG